MTVAMPAGGGWPADDGGAVDAAVELASLIADNGPLAVAATKQVARARNIAGLPP